MNFLIFQSGNSITIDLSNDSRPGPSGLGNRSSTSRRDGNRQEVNNF